MSNDFREKYKSYSTPTLVVIASSELSEYRKEAIEAAQRELLSRGEVWKDEDIVAETRVPVEDVDTGESSTWRKWMILKIMPNCLFASITVGSVILMVAAFLIFTFCLPIFLNFFFFPSNPSPSVGIGLMVSAYGILGALSRTWTRNLISLCVGIAIGIIVFQAVAFRTIGWEIAFNDFSGWFGWYTLSPMYAIGFASTVTGWLITNWIVKRHTIKAARRKYLIAAVSIALIAVLVGGIYRDMTREVIPKAWLLKRVTLSDVEKPDWTTRSDKFGEEWRALKRQMKPGDELWFYERPRCVLCDEGGYALVRKGKPIAKLVIFVS
jgi:hypothetical protein